MSWAVVDLGFGDAGKGTVTDFLVRRYGVPLVVRFNGGAQAGHNVVTPDGRHHTFAQFGAGSFVPGVRTLLGPAFVLHPLGMVVEAEHLAQQGVHDALPRTAVDRRARVISPFQQAANHHRERLRGAAAHGSCGVGVGECVGDSLCHDDTILAADLRDAPRLRRLLEHQRERKAHELRSLGGELPAIFDDPGLIERVVDLWVDLGGRLELVPDSRAVVDSCEQVVFEGAQGVLLDEWWGFHPHTTWSDCTFANAEALTDRPLHRLGVLRSFGVRHGPGPFPGEGSARPDELHNTTGTWQGPVRHGAFDRVLFRYALQVLGRVDSIALTWLDRCASGLQVERIGGLTHLDPGHRTDLQHRERLGSWLQEAGLELEPGPIAPWVDAQIPVSIESYGPRARDKRVIRASTLEGTC